MRRLQVADFEMRRRAILRRLAAAVLLRAVDDAREGDADAIEWLAGDGMELACKLGIRRERVAAWHKCRRRHTKRMARG